MDRLEQYLDQVCRSIGGPRAMRQHVRQELREHLLDAVSQHKAGGLAEEAALDRALAEFGRSEDVRSELEATHGQRLMPVVIDKAMQWKEMTMRAKWLWTTWAYLALAAVVALEVLFITFLVISIIPRFQRLLLEGIIDLGIVEEHGIAWMIGFLADLRYIGGHYTTQMLLLALAALGLFEWRVKSENKPFIRLSALGTVAVGLMAVVMLAAGSLVISFAVGVPALGQMTRPWAVEQIAIVATASDGLEQTLAKKDWGALQKQAEQASNAMSRLSAGPGVYALTRRNEPPTLEELQANLKAAREGILEAQQAIGAKDADRLERALALVRRSFEPLREAAKRSPG